MADTAARTADRMPPSDTDAADASDVGLLIFASIERIREQVRLEQACQRPRAARMSAER